MKIMENKFNRDEYTHSSFDASRNLRDPGKGYRILKIGEVLKDTDEVFRFPNMVWGPTRHHGDTVNGTWRTNCCYRRKIEEVVREYPSDAYTVDGTLKDPGKGYRFLKSGERVIGSDQYWSCVHKEWRKTILFGIQVGNIESYRRKIEDAQESPQAPAVDPGIGYRVLGVGEKIQEGDEYLSKRGRGWALSGCRGDGEVISKDTWTTYRRKVEEAVKEYPDECYGPTGILKTPKDGYRFLKLGEKIQEGDVFPIDYECMAPNHWDKSFDIGVRVHARSCAYIRKVEETKEVKEYPHLCYHKGELKDPGRGYKLLKVGETLTQGDELFRFDLGGFVPISINSNFIIKPEHGCYRRKVDRRNAIPQKVKQATNTLAKDLKTSFEGQKRKFKDKIRSLEECLTKRHEESSDLKKELGIAQKKIKDLEFANNNMAAREPQNKEILKALVMAIRPGTTVEVYTTSHGWVASPVTQTIGFSNGARYFWATLLGEKQLNEQNIYKSWRPWFPKV